MAIIELTTSMTDAEKIAAQNSNNNFRILELDDIKSIENNLFQFVNIYSELTAFYTAGTRTFAYTVANLAKSFRRHATTVYFYVSEVNGTTQVSSIVTATVTLTKQFTAGSTERMIIPLINNLTGTIYTTAIIDAFLKTYYPSGANGYIPTSSGLPFLFEKYEVTTTTTGTYTATITTKIKRYSDGEMIQSLKHAFTGLAIATGSGTTPSTAVSFAWTFQIPFLNTSYTIEASHYGGYFGIRTASEQTTNIQFTPFAFTTNASTNYTANIQLSGIWR